MSSILNTTNVACTICNTLCISIPWIIQLLVPLIGKDITLYKILKEFLGYNIKTKSNRGLDPIIRQATPDFGFLSVHEHRKTNVCTYHGKLQHFNPDTGKIGQYRNRWVVSCSTSCYKTVIERSKYQNHISWTEMANILSKIQLIVGICQNNGKDPEIDNRLALVMRNGKKIIALSTNHNNRVTHTPRYGQWVRPTFVHDKQWVFIKHMRYATRNNIHLYDQLKLLLQLLDKKLKGIEASSYNPDQVNVIINMDNILRHSYISMKCIFPGPIRPGPLRSVDLSTYKKYGCREKQGVENLFADIESDDDEYAETR